MRLNETGRIPFVGEQVTTNWIDNERDVVRVVLSIIRDNRCESGYRIEMSEGIACPCCGRPLGSPIKEWLDSNWAIPIEDKVIINGKIKID